MISYITSSVTDRRTNRSAGVSKCRSKCSGLPNVMVTDPIFGSLRS